MSEPGFHRLTLVFGLASIIAWAYAFNEWWGGTWWGLLLAIAAAIPVGLVFATLPSMLLRVLVGQPHVNDAVLTWSFILGGIALVLYALTAFEGTTRAMGSIAGAEILAGGIGHSMRPDAMR